MILLFLNTKIIKIILTLNQNITLKISKLIFTKHIILTF